MGIFDFFRRPPDPDQPPKPLPPSRQAELAKVFPFPVVGVAASEIEAELSWRREALRPQGQYPVLVGNYDSAVRLLDLWGEPYDLAEELVRTDRLDAAQWFASRKDEDPEVLSDPEQMEIHSGGVGPNTALTGAVFPGKKDGNEVFIASLPILNSPLVPLHLRFGGWNECPYPHVHAGIARYWQRKYGAEIATMASDVVEFTVARPPETDALAMELAWEHFFYCMDIVYQGVGSVATLAKSLRHSTRWYFWWD